MAYKEVNKIFTDNEPVYTNVKEPTGTLNNTLINNDSKYSIDGEIVELQKRHYGTKDASQLLDRSFSELTKTRDSINSANFFNLYREIFFDIPKEGENSHTTLMLESKDYINNYIDPKDDKINELLERVIELENEKTQFPKEHPIFRNGTFLRRQESGGPLGLMQEGRLRLINYDAYRTLRKPLGYVNSEGKALSDADIQNVIGSQTWNELPKWPNEARITAENPGLNDTLSDFIDETPLTFTSLVQIGTNIQGATLTREDINALKFQLDNKTPTEGYRIEDNTNGVIQWELEELLPFNTKGNSRGEIRIFDSSNSQTTSIELEIFNLFNIFANKMNDVGAPPNSPAFNDVINNFYQIIDNADPLSVELAQANEFNNQKIILQNGLSALASELLSRFRQYVWDVDPNRDGQNNKFYWVQTPIDAEIEGPKISRALNFVNINDFNYTF